MAVTLEFEQRIMTCKIDCHVVGEYDPVVFAPGAKIINLKDGRLVDDEGVKFSAIHESNGARIKNRPFYVREWIPREREESDRAWSNDNIAASQVLTQFVS